MLSLDVLQLLDKLLVSSARILQLVLSLVRYALSAVGHPQARMPQPCHTVHM
jgi:hypothetical protein